MSHSWDQTLSATEGSETVSYTSDGSLTYDLSGENIAYDFRAVFDSGTHRIFGAIRDNANGTSDSTLTVSLAGTVVLDCIFNDVDLNALSDADIEAACSDSATATEDDSCDTVRCSTDFECQLFADDDLTDAYETDNVTCTSNCCALAQ